MRKLTSNPPLPLVGEDMDVPLLGGRRGRYVNLDFAASAPALEAVRDAVNDFLPWYSSVHRGAGWKSQLATRAYEDARGEVAEFVGARPDDVVVFTRNTTDSLNLLAATLPDGCRVVAFGNEHHANLLPWRRRDAYYLEPPSSAEQAVGLLDVALARMAGGPVLVTIAGASNVTGELWPVAQLAEVAHRHGARIVVDAAQLAPHAPIGMTAWGVDYLAFSGHKLYAPYGAGVLVGRRDWLSTGEPFLAGGGAVRFVSTDDVAWADAPDRQEAGSPNVVGAVAIGAACRALRCYGMDRIAAEEAELKTYIDTRLREVPRLVRYQLWESAHPRIGVATFNLPGMHHALVAAALAGEYGVAVRDGCFCAHPLMMRLLDVDKDAAAGIRAELVAGHHARVPGAVRLSTGLTTTRADIDQAVTALCELAERGAAWRYLLDDATGRYLPEPDDRTWPTPTGRSLS